jgi:hypothetical protein
LLGVWAREGLFGEGNPVGIIRYEGRVPLSTRGISAASNGARHRA